jgi:hypothetical protein
VARLAVAEIGGVDKLGTRERFGQQIHATSSVGVGIGEGRQVNLGLVLGSRLWFCATGVGRTNWWRCGVAVDHEGQDDRLAEPAAECLGYVSNALLAPVAMDRVGKPEYDFARAGYVDEAATAKTRPCTARKRGSDVIPCCG